MGDDTAPPAISLRGVSVRFGGDHPAKVLDDVSLECAPGEFLALVGESGSGKTTILNVASGLLQPTSGIAEVLGTAPVRARPQLGYMFARDALLPWRTARRNVELGLEILGAGRQERRQAARQMLARVGLEHAQSKLPWQLSQGMRQRVALARTWAREPNLLLMDEPFSALDPHTRAAAQEAFLSLWSATRPSVLLVTHDLAEALLLGDRVMMIAHGRIIREVVVPFERAQSVQERYLSPELRELERDLWDTMKAAVSSPARVNGERR